MSEPEVPVDVLFLCTGNAARSVMAGAMLAARRDDVRITTAGTHVIEGQPMSWRTRDAMKAIGVEAAGHRSRQLRDADVADADLIVAMASEHVQYGRRRHAKAGPRTATLKRLCRDLADGHRDRAGLEHRGEGDVAVDLVLVAAGDGHPVTGIHSERGQRPGQAVAAAVDEQS